MTSASRSPELAGPGAEFASIDQIAAGFDADLIALRHDLHRWPELAGGEQRTAETVASRLRDFGLSVSTGIGGHGVVGILDGARAMIDAGILNRDTGIPEAALDEIYALHCGPVPFDTLAALPGVGLPGLDIGHIDVSGLNVAEHAELLRTAVERVPTRRNRPQ